MPDSTFYFPPINWAAILGTPGAFSPSPHTHSTGDVTSGTLDGDRLPAISMTKKGGVPATGTPAGKLLRDDGTWAVIAGGGDMLAANNLSDLANIATAKTNLSLNNVTNTSDANKPVSTAQQTALDGKQSLDADLTAIAALDSATSGAIASDGAGWVKKTYAQFKTALGLVKADVGLSNVTDDAQMKRSDGDIASFSVKVTPETTDIVLMEDPGNANVKRKITLDSLPVSTLTQTALNGKSGTGHTHAGVYEPANANIQSHVISAHAPANAQKNSDILKAEIEAVLTGVITSHSHSGGGGGLSAAQVGARSLLGV